MNWNALPFRQRGSAGGGGGGVDADYQAVLDGGTALPSSIPTATGQAAGNQLVTDIKAVPGLWAKIKHMYVYMTDGDQDFALLDWKNPAVATYRATRVNSPTFESKKGYLGDRVSAHLSLNWAPLDDTSLVDGETTLWAAGYNYVDSIALRNTMYLVGNTSNSASVYTNRHGTADGRYIGGWGGTVNENNLTVVVDYNSLDFTGDYTATGNMICRINGVREDDTLPITLSTSGNTGVLGALRYAAAYDEGGVSIQIFATALTDAESLALHNAFTTYRTSL